MLFVVCCLLFVVLGCDNSGGAGTPPPPPRLPIFAEGATVQVQLKWLEDNLESNRHFIIEASADEVIPGIGTDTFGHLADGYSGVTITIRGESGSGHTLTLASGYMGNMFEIGATNTLVLQDIILEGLSAPSGNFQPLVRVNGGTLQMMTGAQIVDHGGRGVYVNVGGRLYMNANARIEGNLGGGVRLSGATLTMRDDAIIYGNGSDDLTVMTRGNAVFGTPGNHNAGGGVNAQISSGVRSSVIMEGDSRIENNQQTGGNGGGGVILIQSDLTMRGTTEIVNNRNNTNNGGGVQIRNTSILRMYGNALIQSNHNTNNLNGSGVDTRESGGRIYMNDSAAIKNNWGSCGVQISPGGFLFMRGNDTEISGHRNFADTADVHQVRLSGGAGNPAIFQISGGSIIAPPPGPGDPSAFRFPHANVTAEYGTGAGTGSFSANGSIAFVAPVSYGSCIIVVNGNRVACLCC